MLQQDLSQLPHKSRSLLWEGEPVLEIHITAQALPKQAPARLSAYYQAAEAAWQARWENRLYPLACAAAGRARAASRPFRPWCARLERQITLDADGLLSLRLEAQEQTSSSRIARHRQGDVWQLPRGTPLALSDLFPGRNWRKGVLEQVAAQIQSRTASGECRFSPGWERLLPRRFDPERFYCMSEGPAVFFPLCSIAPYAEGIPEFLLVSS